MSDLDDPKDFIKNLRKTIEKGLDKEVVCYTNPYSTELIGAENILGTLEKGKKAELYNL